MVLKLCSAEHFLVGLIEPMVMRCYFPSSPVEKLYYETLKIYSHVFIKLFLHRSNCYSYCVHFFDRFWEEWWLL